MFNIRGTALFTKELRCLYLILAIISLSKAWVADTSTKIVNDYGQIHTYNFTGNSSFPDHFIVLNQDDKSILLGGRNRIYNLSTYDFSERKDSRIDWPSTEAHSQLCSLKGKTEDDCQNYVRIFVQTAPGKLLICGTNSYKPRCRYYTSSNGKYITEREVEGVGLCPFNPDHNSTAVFSNGHLFSATVADFSGTDPLIYREPQRTELSDLKQLNAPNFVSSVPYGDYIFFFYRETAVEYINCGKVIYSRVARVCRDDKGGPHQFRDRWTTFLKARLNCSVPGEYPFYFDEIQSTSEIVKGRYGSDNLDKEVIYGTLTTPSNAIGGSAICVYSMKDILNVFEGSFKQQETINSNWLPVPKDKVPEPRPGKCVRDSRILQETNVNFVKTHSLMEDAVPALFGKPILIRVSLQYRFTAITVDAQVKTVNDEFYDVIYVGTDDGKVLKVVNIPSETSSKAVVISENTILPNGAPVKQLKVTPGYGNIVVVGRDEVKLANINHCSNYNRCTECISLQDPHCAWDVLQRACVSVDLATRTTSLIQDIKKGDSKKCWASSENKKILNKDFNTDNENEMVVNTLDDNDIQDSLMKNGASQVNCEDGVNENGIGGCSVRQRLVIYTAETLHLVVIGASLAGLFLGFVAGYLFSRRFHPPPQFSNASFIEQHNHLDRLSGNQNGFLTPRLNKDVNLVNIPSNTPPPKKDNLDASKDLNIASDGTLQKIKKTYI